MIDARMLLADLRHCLGPGVGADLRPVIGPLPLHPEEAAAMTRALPSRLAEFSTGRACARAAMIAVGLPEAAVPMGPDRAPVWPADLLGSISHGAGLCAAIVARRDLDIGRITGLGIDIEPDAPLPPGVAGEVLFGEEVACPHTDQRVIFSAKETVYKAFHRQLGEIWGFDAVRVTLTGTGFEARLTVPVPGWPPDRTLQGHLIRRHGVIVTALILRPVK